QGAGLQPGGRRSRGGQGIVVALLAGGAQRGRAPGSAAGGPGLGAGLAAALALAGGEPDVDALHVDAARLEAAPQLADAALEDLEGLGVLDVEGRLEAVRRLAQADLH